MRKRLPMSALITGLLAAPMLGAGALAPATQGTGTPSGVQIVVEAFPAEMPMEVDERMRRMARGEKLDAMGMQRMQMRLASDMQARLGRLIEQSRQG